MQRKQGFSLVETMVGIGIVSIVGLGMYSGFTQLDDAVKYNVSQQSAQTSQDLLLSVLESDLNLHGEGLLGSELTPPCLIEYNPSTNQWTSSCNGDYVDIPSDGIATCRKPPGGSGRQLTVSISVSADLLLEVGKNETPEPEWASNEAAVRAHFKRTSQPLDWVLRTTFETGSCDPNNVNSGQTLTQFLSNELSLSALSFNALQALILDTNASQLAYQVIGGKTSVSYIPNVAAQLQTVGNQTLITQPILINNDDVTPTAIDQLANLPNVTLPFPEYLIRDTADTASGLQHIPAEVDIFVLRDQLDSSMLRVPFEVLQQSSSNQCIPQDPQVLGHLVISPGKHRSETNTDAKLDHQQCVRIAGGSGYNLGSYTLAKAVSTTSNNDEADETKPRLRLDLPSTVLQRASGSSLDGNIWVSHPMATSNASGTVAVELEISGMACGPSSDIQVTIQGTDESVACASGNDPQTLSINLESASGSSFPLSISAASTGATGTLSLEVLPHELDTYLVANNSGASISIVDQGVLPVVEFVKKSGTAKEPFFNAVRESGLTVRFDPPTSASSTTLKLSYASASVFARCGSASGSTHILRELDGWSEDCITEFEVPIGSDEVVLPIQIQPPTPAASALEPSYYSPLVFNIAENPAQYTVGENAQNTTTIQRIPRIQFASSAYEVLEDIPDNTDSSIGWRTYRVDNAFEVINAPSGAWEYQIAVDIDSTGFIAPSAPAAIASQKEGAGDIFLIKDAADGSVQSQVNISDSTPTANFEFEIENDRFVDNGKLFTARIVDIVGGAGLGPQNDADFEVVDQDLCPIGGWDNGNDPLDQFPDLTIGQTPSDHFHTRGSPIIETTEIRGATIRIGVGFDADNDRLIVMGATPNTPSTTQLEYTGVTHLGVTYDVTYLFSQGVMEIEIPASQTAPAPDVVRFIRERIAYRNEGAGAGNRTVTFTLGREVQAWDEHEDGATHYYRYVPFNGTNRTWTQARADAQLDSNQFFGQTGYLATVTSLAENQFLAQRFNENGGAAAGWLGGSDSGTDGEWIWMDGPESNVRFWKGHGGGKSIQPTSDEGTETSTGGRSCTQQDETRDGSDHVVGTDIYYLPFPGNDNGSRRFANWSCNASGSSREPNGGTNENYLQMTGSSKGGGLWNDLPNTPSYDGTNVYGVRGYYIEYGGPEKSEFGTSNLKLSQTSSFSATGCNIDHGSAETMCRAWTDLSAMQTATPGLADFFSPAGLGDGGVFDRTRGVAHVYIRHDTYDEDTDKLVIANSTSTTQTIPSDDESEIINYAATSFTTDVGGDDETFSVTGKYYEKQGYLKVNVTPGATGQEWAEIINNMVEYQNDGAPSNAQQRSITYTLGGGIAWPYHPDGTTHFYRYVEKPDWNWTESRNKAVNANANYYGETGYLSTITSRAEHEFLARTMVRPNGDQPIAWIGGTDKDDEGEWVWNDGPEAGIQFWQGVLTGSLLNSRPIIAGNGQVGTDNLPSCQQQANARDGSEHETGDVNVLDMIGPGDPAASPFRFTKWSCAPNDLSRPEPSGLNTGNQEDYLLLSTTDQGGETWNDTLLAGSSGTDWLNATGYFQEFGGNNEFFNRSTSQTFVITPQQCVLTRETQTSGCLPGGTLTIGTDSNTDDFYGPAPNGIDNSMTNRANVKISIGTYVNQSLAIRDELALRGATGTLSDNQLERTYMNVPVTFTGVPAGTVVNGTWNFTTGVLRLSSVDGDGNAVNISAEAWVSFFNQRIQLFYAPVGEGTTGNREIEFTLGDALAWPDHEDGTIHYYRFVAFPETAADTDKEWTDSRDFAKSNSNRYFGVNGYLTTLTSLQENQFVASGFSDNEGNPAAGWIGGSDKDDENEWVWMDGPEAGMRFFKGRETSIKDNPGSAYNPSSPDDSYDKNGYGDVVDGTNCTAQTSTWHLTDFDPEDPLYTATDQADRILFWRDFDFPVDLADNTGRKRFTNWSCNGGSGGSGGRQPSNSGTGGQDYLLITGSARGGGMWNDVSNVGIPGSGDLYTTTGYYIEYGEPGAFTNRKFSASVTLDSQCQMVSTDTLSPEL